MPYGEIEIAGENDDEVELSHSSAGAEPMSVGKTLADFPAHSVSATALPGAFQDIPFLLIFRPPLFGQFHYASG